MIDFGLVKREQCRCGGVIIMPTNASEDTVIATLQRHYATREHQARDVSYHHYLEAPPTAPVPSSPRSELTTRGAIEVREVEVSSPPSRGGVSIRADGYDFKVRRGQ